MTSTLNVTLQCDKGQVTYDWHKYTMAVSKFHTLLYKHLMPASSISLDLGTQEVWTSDI